MFENDLKKKLIKCSKVLKTVEKRVEMGLTGG